MGAIGRVDAYQREHRWVGLPLAVIYKFFDDQGAYLAALLTYYGFLSLFPLLLLLVTILGMALHDNPGLQQQVLHSALSEFPVIGDQIGRNIHSFHGSSLALVAGFVGGLYGSLGVAQAAQNALNQIWAVPRHARPNPIRSRLKSLVFLLILAGGLIVTLLLSATASAANAFGTHLDTAMRIGETGAALCFNAGLLLATYHLLTQRAVPLRHLAGAAVSAACAWQGLQWGGAYYVNHVLRGASATYGMFGIVLGLLAWIYLGALVFVLAAEATAVRVRRLWPRSLLTPFTDHVQLTKGDRRAYESYAMTQTFKSFQEVDVAFRQSPTPGDDTATPAPPASPPAAHNPNEPPGSAPEGEQ